MYTSRGVVCVFVPGIVPGMISSVGDVGGASRLGVGLDGASPRRGCWSAGESLAGRCGSGREPAGVSPDVVDTPPAASDRGGVGVSCGTPSGGAAVIFGDMGSLAAGRCI